MYTVLNAEGKVAHDEQTHRVKLYDGTAVRSVVTTADVDDTPANGADTDPVSSNWAYDFINTLTTQSDLPYATAAGTWTRLAKGTAYQMLRMNATATAPEWGETTSTKEIFINAAGGSGTGVVYAYGDFITNSLGSGEYWRTSLKVPPDFVSLTSCKIILIPRGTGNYQWSADTDFGTVGEACTTHSDNTSAGSTAITGTIIKEADISAAFTGIAPNDYVGITFTITGIDTSAVALVGLVFKYE